MGIRLVVTGGRYFSDASFIDRKLSAIHRKHKIDVLINGLSTGADKLSRDWAIHKGIKVEDFPAKWNQYGRRAGPVRNQEMIDLGKPDFGIAFKGGDGTRDIINKMARCGIVYWDTSK